MDTCAKCGAELGVGRFCVNCGHRIGAPAPMPEDGWAAAERPTELGLQHRPAEPSATATPVAAVAPSGSVADEPWLPGKPVPDEGPPRLNWGAWVLGAMALITAVLLGLSFLGEDDTTATDGARGTGTAGQGVVSGGPGDRAGDGGALPSGKFVDLARDARVKVPTTAPPTRDLNGKIVPYDAERMVDGRRKTAWRMPGDGTGAEITFFLDRRAVITQVGMINGYAKRIRGIDWYPHNRRIVRATWTFDDGTSVEQVLQQRRRLQLMDVGPVRTRSVVLTLTDVTIPGGGGLGRDYTPISTVVLMGKRVG